ncbi:uncharacterized protein ARMOST_15402 [Armillaria ostoyae]|uniref:Uncharacterized protein n=1 Tax=Armillaria ostoyae TaxID=47428 RepID=A0A284RTB6_ARMOS|nr:uncharacterized protein ARMOST_15402 [Armillaria ostoyae]
MQGCICLHLSEYRRYLGFVLLYMFPAHNHDDGMPLRPYLRRTPKHGSPVLVFSGANFLSDENSRYDSRRHTSIIKFCRNSLFPITCSLDDSVFLPSRTAFNVFRSGRNNRLAENPSVQRLAGGRASSCISATSLDLARYCNPNQ